MSDRKPRTPPSAKLFRLSHVRKLRECEQVAAVCYRVRGAEIEFLLVRTGSGHWTFPKGGVEPGLTHAQAAALEAFEEAGVHGRMEETPFIRYVRRRGRSATSAEKEIGTSAHLCEVLRLVRPQEPDRNPTWFSAVKAKKKLLEGRTAAFGIELIRVVDRAVERIQRMSQAVAQPADALQQVRFEASAALAARTHVGEVSLDPRLRDAAQAQFAGSISSGRRRGKVVPIGPTLVMSARPVKRLPGPATSNKSGPQFARLENDGETKSGPRPSLSARKKRD